MHFSSFVIVLGKADFPSMVCVGGFYMTVCEPLVACGGKTEQMVIALPWDPTLTFG